MESGGMAPRNGRIFDTMGCSEAKKHRLATYQLTYAAADWWESERATLEGGTIQRMTWTAFKELFLENYFTQTERNRKEKEFIVLVQGNRTVREYTVQFERLFRFAYHMVDTPEKKNQKYDLGLSLALQRSTFGHLNQSFKALVGMANGFEEINGREQRRFMNRPPQRFNQGQRQVPTHTQGNKRNWNGERKPPSAPYRNQPAAPSKPALPQGQSGTMNNNYGVCFNCGIPGHMSKDCWAPKKTSRTDVVCFNCNKKGHISKDCKAPRGGYYGALAQGQPGQTRLNAIIPNEAGFHKGEQHNLEGTLKLFNSQVKALFDTGASNFFITIRIVQRLGLVPQALDVALNVVSPLGVSVKLGKVCKDCPLKLKDQNLPADLIVLSMKEFDVILGIDWLTKYHAKLDCVSKSISFSTPRSSPFNF